MSIKKKIGKASILLILRKSWNSILNLLVMMYLARELDPSSFGLLAISSVFINIIANLAVGGIGEYIVYYKKEDQTQMYHSAFWLNLLLTMLVSLVILGTVPLWSNFYHDERIVNLVYFLLIGFFAEMLSVVPISIFRKSMEFQKMIFLQTIFNTLIGLGKVAFAFFGFGIYSLVFPIAIFQPMLAVAIMIASGFRPQLHFKFHFWKPIIAYTKHIIGGRVLGRVVNEGDNILVGKLLSLQELGYYTLAFQLSNIFTNTLLPIISTLSLPVFSNTPEQQLKTNYLKMINLISSISIPVLLLMIAISEPLVVFFYGPHWLPAVVPLQILCLFTIFRSITSPTSAIFSALGKPQIGFYYSLIFTPFFLLSIWLGSYWGIVGVCVCVTAMRISGGQVTLYISSRLLKFNIFEIYKIVSPYIISGAISSISVYLLFGGLLPIWLAILYSTILFVLVYLFSLRLLFKRRLIDLVIMIIDMVPSLRKIISKILFIQVA
jgi:O-antigen/teichoic acid export membrane protein